MIKQNRLKKITNKEKFKYLLSSFYNTLKVVKTGDILKFAEENRYLGKNETSTPRMYKPFPYQIEPYKVLNNDDFRELVLVWASQTGKSLTFENIILYYMVAENASCMYSWPTKDAASKCAQEKIEPMFRNSPTIKKLLSSNKRSSDNRKLYKKLKNGSYIRLIGCTPTELAGESVRLVIADEVDRMEEQGEGDPVNLLHRRCASFPNKIKLTTSTPKYEETSRIWKRFLAGTQHYYYIKSPTTNQYFKLEWANFKIDRDNPELSTLIDPTSGLPISDDDRKNLIYRGEWKATVKSGIYSFHLNGMYRVTPTTKGYKSAYHEWAIDYMAAEKSGKLQDFNNTFLSIPVKEETGEKLEHGDYSKYLIDINLDSISNDIIAITSGTDIQQNRKECYVYGWTQDLRPTLLESIIIDGEPADIETWNELDKFLGKSYTREDGKKILITSSFIDSGNWQNTVLNFTENKSYRGIFPVRGATTVDAPLMEKTQNRKRQWIVGTNEAKDLIFSDYFLGRIKFNKAFADEDYFKQLFSETKQHKNGKYSYHKITQRNESLDTFVYALAAVKRKNFIKFASGLFNNPTTKVDNIEAELKKIDEEIKVSTKIKEEQKPKNTIFIDPFVSDNTENCSISF